MVPRLAGAAEHRIVPFTVAADVRVSSLSVMAAASAFQIVRVERLQSKTALNVLAAAAGAITLACAAPAKAAELPDT